MAKASLKPRPKVAAAAVGGSAVTAVIALAHALGVELTPEVAGAIVTIVSFVAGYFKAE